MKKLFAILAALMVAISMSAQTYTLIGYRYHQKQSYENSWNGPYSCHVPIVVDADNDFIYINSDRTQYYHVLDACNAYVDSDGDTVIKYQCKDEEAIWCTIRLIKRRNGTVQLYIDYSNISWVYDIRAY